MISVVILPFNQGQYRVETILPVLSTLISNLEIIVIDGKVWKISAEILEKYSSKYWQFQKR